MMKDPSLLVRQLQLLVVISFFSLKAKGVPITKELQHFPTLLVEGGSEAEPNEFPWQVSLRAGLNDLHFCGGVIIDQRTVLTTASCAGLVQPYFTSVVAGNLCLTIANASESQQIVKATSVHIHPNYADKMDYSNDIAILKMNTEFLWTKDVTPMPTLYSSTDVPTTEYGVISGWGTKHEEEISLQNKLQKATVKLLHSNQECQRIIEDNQSEKVLIEDSMICITTPNDNAIDSCTGDEGGPLIIYEDGHPILFGLVSFGIGCGRQNMPSVCISISPYIDFIRQYQESTFQ